MKKLFFGQNLVISKGGKEIKTRTERFTTFHYSVDNAVLIILHNDRCSMELLVSVQFPEDIDGFR